MVCCWGNEQIIEFNQLKKKHQLFECKELKVSFLWFLVISPLKSDIVAHAEPAIHCHEIFRLNFGFSVWICQADCSAEKKSKTGLSVYVCVYSQPSFNVYSTLSIWQITHFYWMYWICFGLRFVSVSPACKNPNLSVTGTELMLD